jgi:F0F1-type ATP synthase assembly protein I
MPLSDHEKQVLAEMEAALSAADPRFAHTLRSDRKSPHLTYILIGALLIIAGLGVIIGGLMAKMALIGIVGFLLALGGGFSIIQSSRVKVTQKITEGKVKSHRAKRNLTTILEERWERRRWQQ